MIRFIILFIGFLLPPTFGIAARGSVVDGDTLKIATFMDLIPITLAPRPQPLIL